MNEHDFDALLESSASELPPDDVAHDVTPWRRAMNQILTGFALGVVTVSILRLEIFLPAVGAVLQILGFRSLRRENRWFTACWVLSLLRGTILLPALVLNATIWQTAFYAAVGSRLSYVGISLQLALVFCFWRAVKDARRGEPADAAKMLFVWYVVLTGLCRIGSGGIILGLALLAAFVLVLRSLFSLAGEMEASGYSLEPARVKLSDTALVRCIAAVVAVGMLCGYGFFGRYPMAWEKTEKMLSSDAQTVKAELLSLDYPADALDDLTEDEILSCRGAKCIAVQESDEPMNEGREVEEHVGDGYGTVYVTRVYDVKEMHFTSVAVQLSASPERWKIFHHFRWTEGTFCGTESVQLWTAAYGGQNWTMESEVFGRVLYDTAAGESVSAAFYSISEDSNGAFYAEFSFPARAANARGYVSYEASPWQEGNLLNSWINYTHQRSLFQYPVQTAAEARKSSGWDEPRAFITAQEALQFWAYDGKIEKIGS